MNPSQAILLASLLLPALAIPCLWDTETVVTEDTEFPTELEFLAGKFARHSDAYYRWRVENRKERFYARSENGSKPNAERGSGSFDDLNDLAVAYDKLGQHDSAIATMEKSLARNGTRYEILANLGTFHFHNRNLAKGLPFIDSAIAINPDAHFGREIYQRLLVEFVLGHEYAYAHASRLPLSPGRTGSTAAHGFARFLAGKKRAKGLSKTERDKAITGVLGMMKFGDHRSPILLEAYGDLVAARGRAGKALATMAYLKASRMVADSSQAKAYRDLAAAVAERPSALEASAQNLTMLMRQGDAHFQGISSDEKRWIQAGSNVDSLYSAKYLPKKSRSGF